MGVPTFFRWLALRYPRAVVDVSHRLFLPDFHCFYIDMNGIIHSCASTQPEHSMIERIFIVIEELVSIVNPRELVYLAIDGVAPRAKINQQRARRYTRSNEEDEHNEFDSNCISPGTEFISRFARELHTFILKKLSADWEGLSVIVSDSSVAGEGEHKILEHIKSQRALDCYDPNTSHVVYSADADLIMLALTTHEAHFYIFRECHFPIPGQFIDESTLESIGPQLCFVKIPVLKEYLFFEFRRIAVHCVFDFERVLDDFVLLCFFAGNDFLPSIPSVSIRDGAIDGLIYIYCQLFPCFDGYLTENGKILYRNLNFIFEELRKAESVIFTEKKRRTEY